MWYFSWILGVSLACCFAILNAMWYEIREDNLKARKKAPPDGKPAGAGKRR